MNDERRANQLYWHSSQSVNSIAEELGFSKGRLYSTVRPLPAGTPCSSCGAELVYENRTARDRESAICVICESGSESGPSTGPSFDGARSTAAATWKQHELVRWSSAPLTARVLVGAAIGGAVGFAVARWLRE